MDLKDPFYPYCLHKISLNIFSVATKEETRVQSSSIRGGKRTELIENVLFEKKIITKTIIID
jgi:hypothetical protein